MSSSNRIKFYPGSPIQDSKELFIVEQCNVVAGVDESGNGKGGGLYPVLRNKFKHADFHTIPNRQINTLLISHPKKVDSNSPIIIAFLSQYDGGGPQEPYDTMQNRLQWFKHCLDLFGNWMHSQGYNNHTIAIPYKIGCGLGGGIWPDYLNAIENFADKYSINVNIHEYDSLINDEDVEKFSDNQWQPQFKTL